METGFTHRVLSYLLNSGNAEVVLQHYPYYSSAQGFAMIETGQYEEVLRRFSGNYDVVIQAQIYSGRNDDILAHNPIEVDAVNALVAKNDFATLYEKFPTHRRTGEWRIIRGEAEKIIKEFPNSDLSMRALTVLGRPQEALRIARGGPAATYAYMALGQPEKILDYGTTQPKDLHCALIGFAEQGNKTAFDNLLAKVEATHIHLYQATDIRNMYLQSVIIPFICSRLDPAYNIRAGFAHALQQGSHVKGGRCAYSAKFVLGDIDERAFAAQPNKRNIDLYTNISKAMRAELNNDTTLAHRLYATCLTSPDVSDIDDRAIYHFVKWREKATASNTP